MVRTASLQSGITIADQLSEVQFVPASTRHVTTDERDGSHADPRHRSRPRTATRLRPRCSMSLPSNIPVRTHSSTSAALGHEHDDVQRSGGRRRGDGADWSCCMVVARHSRHRPVGTAAAGTLSARPPVAVAGRGDLAARRDDRRDVRTDRESRSPLSCSVASPTCSSNRCSVGPSGDPRSRERPDLLGLRDVDDACLEARRGRRRNARASSGSGRDPGRPRRRAHRAPRERWRARAGSSAAFAAAARAAPSALMPHTATS